MTTLTIQGPLDVAGAIADRVRTRRLAAGLTQRGLADRSGTSLSSVRKFERTGHIAFDVLIRIAFALDAVEGFDALFPDTPRSIDDLLAKPRRQRGWKT